MSSSTSTTSSLNEPVCFDMFDWTKKDSVKPGFYCTRLFKNIVCCGCGWQSGNFKLTLCNLNFIHKSRKIDCEMSKHVEEDINNFVKYKKFVSAIEVKDTFLF